MGWIIDNLLTQIIAKKSIPWRTAFFAPYRLIFHPGKLGMMLRRAPRSAIFCTLLLDMLAILLLALPLLVIGTALDDRSSIPATWQRFFNPNYFDPGDALICFAPLVVAVVLAITSFLAVVDVHRHGSLLAGLVHCLIAAIAGLPMLTSVACTGGILIMVFSDVIPRHPDWIDVIVFAAFSASCFWTIVSWFGRLAKGIAKHEFPLSENKLCEGCGYDITYAAADGRCPECARPVALSLRPQSPRSGNPWSTNRRVWRWYPACLTQLANPARACSRLILRDGMGAARKFAFYQFFHMGLLAGAWFFVFAYLAHHRNWLEDATIGLFVFPCVIPIIGWLLARAVASIVALVWFSRGLLRDGRWLAKVARYETAYLWVFCAFDGTMITSFVLHGNWISRLIREHLNLYRVLFIGPELMILLAGNAMLIILWFFRYRIILRSIQWSNY